MKSIVEYSAAELKKAAEICMAFSDFNKESLLADVVNPQIEGITLGMTYKEQYCQSAHVTAKALSEIAERWPK